MYLRIFSSRAEPACGRFRLLGSWPLLLAWSIFAAAGCRPEAAKEKVAGKKLRVVTTTGIIADAARQLTGDRAEVISIMGPGVDPHLYKATQGDLNKFTSADLVVYNGLHLEGKMGEVLEKLGRSKKVIAMSEGLQEQDLRKAAEFQGAFDPHIWFDVALWKKASLHLAAALEKADPANAAFYQERAQIYGQQLDSLHQEIKQQILTIPAPQRVLITAHDAFGYFGRAYNIEVRGLQGISTMSEFGLQDVSSLVQFIADRKIKAVFVESSVPKKSIEAVVGGVNDRGHKIRIGGTLYSDALGDEGTAAGTYTGMVRHNVSTITEALR